nr:Na+/H+ antiporter NhaA [Rouxiella sp. S1S-2]
MLCGIGFTMSLFISRHHCCGELWFRKSMKRPSSRTPLSFSALS